LIELVNGNAHVDRNYRCQTVIELKERCHSLEKFMIDKFDSAGHAIENNTKKLDKITILIVMLLGGLTANISILLFMRG
jgi:hypothetical protein